VDGVPEQGEKKRHARGSEPPPIRFLKHWISSRSDMLAYLRRRQDLRTALIEEVRRSGTGLPQEGFMS
jgi:hypothetical protein